MGENIFERSIDLFDILANSLESSYIFMFDIKSGKYRWSRAAMEYFNIPTDKDVENIHGDASYALLRAIHPDDLAAFEEDFEKVVRGETDMQNGEYRMLNRYGTYVWVMCRGTVLRNAQGEIVLFAGAMTNLGHTGKYDATTNLKNIYEFRSDLYKLMYDMKEKGQRVGIMMLGIDGFGRVNEKYNYLFGNNVLRSFGRQINEKKDEAMEIYRMDGDKFACLWPGATKEQLRDMFHVFQETAQHATVVDGKEVPISISGGALFYPDNGQDIEMLHRNLEYALHWTKKNDRRNLGFFTKEILEESLREIEIMDELMDSVRDNCRGFFLCYQPIIHNESGELYSCEALCRWMDKNGRRVPPMEFIPLLESTGAIVDVGNWILETGLRQLSEWQKVRSEMKININVSYLQFQHEEFMGFVMDMLKKYKVAPECLVLELTETCKIVDMDGLRTEFKFFRDQGIHVALDDFGTGYASVSTLKELPIDSVKIDHGFVSQLPKNQSDRHIIEYLINLSQKLGIEVCVEGIETATIRSIVQSYAPDSLQGYYFSHPLEAEEFFAKFVRL